MGESSSGFATGVSIYQDEGPINLGLIAVGAPDLEAGGMAMVGARYTSPTWVFGEVLLGFTRLSALGTEGLGWGAGLGVEIPLGEDFALTVGGAGAFAFGDDGLFVMVYAGPSLRL